MVPKDIYTIGEQSDCSAITDSKNGNPLLPIMDSETNDMWKELVKAVLSDGLPLLIVTGTTTPNGDYLNKDCSESKSTTGGEAKPGRPPADNVAANILGDQYFVEALKRRNVDDVLREYFDSPAGLALLKKAKDEGAAVLLDAALGRKDVSASEALVWDNEIKKRTAEFVTGPPPLSADAAKEKAIRSVATELLQTPEGKNYLIKTALSSRALEQKPGTSSSDTVADSILRDPAAVKALQCGNVDDVLVEFAKTPAGRALVDQTKEKGATVLLAAALGRKDVSAAEALVWDNEIKKRTAEFVAGPPPLGAEAARVKATQSVLTELLQTPEARNFFIKTVLKSTTGGNVELSKPTINERVEAKPEPKPEPKPQPLPEPKPNNDSGAAKPEPPNKGSGEPKPNEVGQPKGGNNQPTVYYQVQPPQGCYPDQRPVGPLGFPVGPIRQRIRERRNR